jgi:hypothetical protein
MKKVLRKNAKKELYYFVDGERIIGIPPGLRGDISDLRGDISGLRGNISGLRGDISGLTGDLDEAEITDEERRAGVDIASLIEDAK